MFRTIARLLFGGGEEAAEEVKPGVEAVDGWLVVNHQEAGGCDNQDAQLAAAQQLSSTSQGGDTPASTEKNSPSHLEPTAPPSSSTTSRAVANYVSQPKAVAELTQVTCAQKAKACSDRRHASRNAIQRQNHVHQVAQRNSFHLQQPGHRSLSH
uniref:Uncharacterized protein n=1 Tax=Fundulus heteroclitus TaxID=8078 RepID=A0A146Z806_FUNHE